LGKISILNFIGIILVRSKRIHFKIGDNYFVLSFLAGLFFSL